MSRVSVARPHNARRPSRPSDRAPSSSSSSSARKTSASKSSSARRSTRSLSSLASRISRVFSSHTSLSTETPEFEETLPSEYSDAYDDMAAQGWLPLCKYSEGKDGVILIVARESDVRSDAYKYLRDSPPACPLPVSHRLSLRGRMYVAKLFKYGTKKQQIEDEIVCLHKLGHSAYTPSLYDYDKSRAASLSAPHWLIMDALCGGNLPDLMSPRMPHRAGEAVAFHMFAQLFEALDHCVQSGFVSADPIPPNVMVDARKEREIGMPNFYLVDFSDVCWASATDEGGFTAATRRNVVWLGNYLHLLLHGCVIDATQSDPWHRRNRYTGKCFCAGTSEDEVLLSYEGQRLFDEIMSLTQWEGKFQYRHIRDRLVPQARQLSRAVREDDPFVQHVVKYSLPDLAGFPSDAKIQTLMKVRKDQFAKFSTKR